MEERHYILWINSFKKISVKDFYALLDYFGNIESVFLSDINTLRECNLLTDEKIEEIINSKKDNFLERKIQELDEKNTKFITINDSEYPFLLKNIHLPPPILYYKGLFDKDLFQNSISIVGSRSASYYGLKTSERLAYELASNEVTIISGLARGVDTAAHLGAIKAKGKTVAVLGCGVDIVYPKENKFLYEKIIDSGAVISEFPLGMQPFPYNFPRRNRIISGLSMGTVVVEAAKRSGSLITAKYALEQGREVYSLPGNINNTNSQGTNQLIKDGAKIVTSSADILEDVFPMLGLPYKENKEKKQPELTPEEKEILELIKLGYNSKDELFYKAKLPMPALQYILTTLEIKNKIATYKGNYYIK